MRIDIMTLFTDMCDSVLGESIIGRARKKGAIDVATISKITGDIIETVKTCNQIVQEGIKTRQDASLKIESDLKKMIEVCTSKDVA